MARVLFVEDDRAAAKLVLSLLEGAGHHVDHVVNGLAAIDLLAGEEYDVLITDMMMGRMDGRELSEWVRAEPRGVALPIIMTTGLADCESLPWVEELGIDVMPKPIKLRDLLERVATYGGQPG